MKQFVGDLYKDKQKVCCLQFAEVYFPETKNSIEINGLAIIPFILCLPKGTYRADIMDYRPAEDKMYLHFLKVAAPFDFQSPTDCWYWDGPTGKVFVISARIKILNSGKIVITSKPKKGKE